jgi:transposase InsO family protein
VANLVSYFELNVGDVVVWHSRLCHVNFVHIIQLSRLNLIQKIPIVRRSKCHACVNYKQPRKPFNSVEDKSLAPLDLIHSDLCERNEILARAAKKYFTTFIDDATTYCYLYLIKTKDEALNCFKIYKAEVENQLEKKIKQVRSDRGEEYISNEFGEYCVEHEIIHETGAPYSPKSNGVVERKNRTLIDLVNAMLDSSGLPKSW